MRLSPLVAILLVLPGCSLARRDRLPDCYDIARTDRGVVRVSGPAAAHGGADSARLVVIVAAPLSPAGNPAWPRVTLTSSADKRAVWSPPSSRDSMQVLRVPPGRYHVRVKALGWHDYAATWIAVAGREDSLLATLRPWPNCDLGVTVGVA